MIGAGKRPFHRKYFACVKPRDYGFSNGPEEEVP